MVSCAGLFGSGGVADDKQELQSRIALLQTQRELLEIQNKRETARIAEQISKEKAVLSKINENERLEKNYGDTIAQAKIIENALALAEHQKAHPNGLRIDDEYPCDESCFFISETHNQKLAARKLLNAIEGREYNERMSLFACCGFATTCIKSCICGWFCCYPSEAFENNAVDWCGDFQDRKDATYFRDGVILLAQNKLEELKSQQEKIQKKLNPAAPQAVRSKSLEEVVESLIMDRGEEKADYCSLGENGCEG